MTVLSPDKDSTSRVVRLGVDELREPLLDLWRRNLPEALPARFDWLYADGHSDAWVLHDANEQPIGAAGLMPRRVAIAGRVVNAAVAIDLNVNAERRAVGPALLLVREAIASAEQDGLAMIVSMPIRAAAGVLKLARYRQVAETSQWTKLLRSESTLRRRLRSRLAARVLAPVADVALRWLAPDGRSRLPAEAVVDEVTQFDARFDRLWLNVTSQFDVIGERTADYLTWRFLRCPEVRYRVCTLARRDSDELLGYIVWHESERSVSIADMLATDNAALAMLLSEFSRRMWQMAAEAIRVSCLGPADVCDVLKAAGFSRRSGGLPVLVQTLGEQVKASGGLPFGDRWWLTTADHDVDA